MTTRAAAVAAFDTNADYDDPSTGSVAKARAFISACRTLLRFPIRSRSTADGEVEFDPQSIREQLAAAQAFVARNINSGGRVLSTRYFSR
jgi:hypothetical protein